MSKIIRIKDDSFVFGLDDKSIREARKSDCEFVSEISMEVEVFGNESSIVVHRVEKTNENN